jgi:hypothetical protein
MKLTAAFLLVAVMGHEAFGFTPAAFKPSATRVGPLCSTIDDSKMKVKKLAKLETLKIDSESLVHPLKDVSSLVSICCLGSKGGQVFFLAEDQFSSPTRLPSGSFLESSWHRFWATLR